MSADLCAPSTKDSKAPVYATELKRGVTYTIVKSGSGGEFDPHVRYIATDLKTKQGSVKVVPVWGGAQESQGCITELHPFTVLVLG